MATPTDTPPTIDPTVPERSLTFRAVATGAALGALLSVCNVYTGLKIGWGFNMSIVAALLSFGFWGALTRAFGTPRWTIQENNINQTGASAAASISSAGLVSAIPALTMLDGYAWTWPKLVVWLLCCSLLGVAVALVFRRQMLVVDRLPFASGVVTATTLQEMYAHGAEGMARVRALLAGAAVAAAWKVTVTLTKLKPVGLGWLSLPVSDGGALAKAGVSKVSAHNLTFAFDPSLLMVGAGAIIGMRSGTSMLVGAIASWGFVGHWLLESGRAAPGASPEVMWSKGIGEWLIWPGVALLVASSLLSLGFSLPQIVRAFRRSDAQDAPPPDPQAVPARWLWIGIAVITVAVMLTGRALFGMSPLIGLAAVLLTSVLAIVALRVSGETNVTPVGPMGKVTQLSFAVLDPGNVSTNLMAANVTGGSASQAGDMMHDLKTGLILGTSQRAQALSQVVGVIAGALAGAAIYLIIVPDPRGMLMTAEWAAPAVAQWKAVAEVFRDGLDKLPSESLTAMGVGAGLGVALTLAEKFLPAGARRFVPSASGFGIAVLIPAYISAAFFIGAVLGQLAKRFFASWSARFLMVAASGTIAGESLTGAVDAVITVVQGLSR
jgi:uncharacterized oligopeptide transporter (OPT) family protein